MNSYANSTPGKKHQAVSNSLIGQSAENKSNFQLRDNRPRSVIQKKQVEAMAIGGTVQRKNNTGLPDQLKSGIENLSGHSMDDVKVHYNSDKPAQLNAHAYAQGTDIHIAPNQEKHLPHEAWHVVQQKQGRVKPIMQMKGKVNINDDKGLEKEADVMGTKASQPETFPASAVKQFSTAGAASNSTIQRRMGIEAELTVPVTELVNNGTAEGRVRSFLGAGVGYKEQFQANVNGFHIDTDKDPIAQTVRSAKDFVNLQLVNINANTRTNRGWGSSLIEGAANIFGKSYDQHTLIPQHSLPVANMEYVSLPFDEQTPEGRLGLQNTMAAMRADMNAKLVNGRNGLHAQGAYNYGVPAEADWRTFARNTGINEAQLLGRRDAILNAITNRLYVQVTAGILPAGIPALQKEAAGDNDVTGQADSLGITQVLEDQAKIRSLVTSRSAEVAENIVQQLIEKGGKLHNIKSQQRLLQSLQGYIALINSYIFAEAVIKAHVGTVHKNMVPFFLKLPLHQAQAALDVRVRPAMWSDTERATLAVLMDREINRELGRVSGILRKPYYGGITVDRPSLEAAIRGWLPHVLDGSADAFSDAQLQACTSIQPEAHSKSRAIQEPVPGNPHLVRASQEKVLALEYRMIRENLNLTPESFAGTVNKIMDQVRRANDV